MDSDGEDDMVQRHKQEAKDLHAKCQQMKKAVPKGDKKKKKEVAEEIAKLEQELEARHASDRLESKGDALCDEEDDSVLQEQNDETEEAPQQRLSRAAKRRNKKAQEEKERELRCREEMQKSKNGPRVTETNAIKEVLKDLGLTLHDIPADGNCLYCAVNHQLETTGRETYSVSKLRKLTADFMKENKEDFLPFMYNESDEPVSEDYFDSYCKEVATTKLWGGQLELRALSTILRCPIKVIQASGPPTLQGESFRGPELILAYHRHLYRLGEHYNSTVVAPNDE